jgi:hypothetical protein
LVNWEINYRLSLSTDAEGREWKTRSLSGFVLKRKNAWNIWLYKDRIRSDKKQILKHNVTLNVA